MPIMTGFESFQAIRNFEKERRKVEPTLKDIPYICTTSYTNDEIFKQAHDLGIAEVLLTPLSLETFKPDLLRK